MILDKLHLKGFQNYNDETINSFFCICIKKSSMPVPALKQKKQIRKYLYHCLISGKKQ